jgi:flagellar biosynthesis protein FliP
MTEPKPANKEKYDHLMANLKREIKRLSRNDLVRNYAELFAQFMLMQKQNDELRTLINAKNDSKNETKPETKEIENEIK